LEPLCPSKISQTVLYSKPILLAGGKIAQLGAESQFSPDFGHTFPTDPRYLTAVELKDPRSAPLDDDEPEEKARPHATFVHGKTPWLPT
jgi:hypothetical protein